MTDTSKVVWAQGMFVLPQHFQQHDRYLENLINGRCLGLQPYSWGFYTLEIDHHLLKREHPGFLEPIDAVQEGFEDVMNHQLAMNAGIQASLLEALEQFDPQRFVEKNKDKSPFQTKGKYWRDYCAAYPELKDQALEGVFGKAFVRAYEEQLEKLRSKKKKS